MIWGNVRGSASELNLLDLPQADPKLQGGKRIDLCLGMHLVGGKKIFRNQRLKVKFCLPVYQNLDGPQLKTKWLVDVHWTIAAF